MRSVVRLEFKNYGESGMSGSAIYDVDIRSGLVVGNDEVFA